jgi:peptidoglycan/LPS O-acetylase OafA/YrhL
MPRKNIIRKDIQIFRAIAVTAVIAYHFNSDLTPQGFLGVDLFFVLSGFLITKQIVNNSQNGTFLLSNFYFKRFKRIIPSLISSSIFTIAIGYYNLSLEHFYELFRGLKYSLLFSGNIFFSQVINYFSIEKDRNLIINLWSLSVEEQFYIVLPFLIIFSLKVKKVNILYFFLLCFGVSLISFSETFYNSLSLNKIFFNYDNYVFYSPFTRTTQFLIGSVAATLKPNKKFVSSSFNYLLIAILIVLLFTKIDFYNQMFIISCTFFLLISETSIKVNKPLKILVHLGNISFSLYLFHQPILAGIRNHNFYATPNSVSFIDITSPAVLISLCLVIYMVSLINYNFVEIIYRKHQIFDFKKFKFTLVGFSIILIISLNPSAISSIYSQGTFQVEPQGKVINTKPGTNYLRNTDNELCINKDTLNSACKFGTGNKEFIILGDSTVSSLVSGFLSSELLSKYTIIEYTQAGCFPAISVCNFTEGSQYYEDILSLKDSVILIGGRYNFDFIKSSDFKNTINTLIASNNHVILIGYLPSPKSDEVMFYKKNNYYLKSNNTSHFDNEETLNLKYEQLLINLNIIETEGLTYIEIFNSFCEDSLCNYFNEDKALFIDGSHLSFFGSQRIIENSQLLEALNGNQG